MSELIKGLLDRAYEDMDPSTGMFPEHWTCRVCGRRLNADGGHPAELYAGTFTGLCYGCERGEPYVVRELPDGARLMSHPPACPSWRRNRTEHWGYLGCENCGGMGAKMRYSSMNQYTEYCRPCLERVTAPRKRAEVELLRLVASVLEGHSLGEVHEISSLTPTQATVAGAARAITKVVLKRWRNEPSTWQPQSYVLRNAEARLTKAQMKAKRPDTLRRHLVTALRAEADELQTKGGGE